MTTVTTTSLPPGPTVPAAMQTLGMALRQRPYLERQRRRHGAMFTIKIMAVGRFVALSDPALIKQVFTAPPEVLHAGDHSPLRAILGEHSLLGIDEGRHLEQRRLLLPPFKGQRMRAYEGLIEEIAARGDRPLPGGRRRSRSAGRCSASRSARSCARSSARPAVSCTSSRSCCRRGPNRARGWRC